MEDIDRFRIACNYLSDIFEMVENLKGNHTFKSYCQILSEKDCIFEDRNNPHRALHLILSVPMTDFPRKVELQLILSEVLNCKSLTEQELEKIYSEKILRPDYKPYFHYFFERLANHPFEFRKVAYRLLKELSQQEYLSYQGLWELSKEILGKDDREGFEDVLAYMEDEFYIRKSSDNTYSFFCKILKDWWQRHKREM